VAFSAGDLPSHVGDACVESGHNELLVDVVDLLVLAQLEQLLLPPKRLIEVNVARSLVLGETLWNLEPLKEVVFLDQLLRI